ncbi:hypothetical protein W97_07060 [Coniosporium apollinis CBS 100218]|uniref:Cyclin N-terminal domain-containing protein n=1 Tax=Coniosporium apollinis (strain CBS 100218) TaxID=1168221 RepID=R7Z0S0_CONA1|nr:uncharacterized protein W97_07060 [Coniosporium apollinis CBS 100218]EON67805.1 hypothetical protein W97_07060 [Coniosporium apollinis CBS 100218]
MPSFYPRTAPRQLPLTPPEFIPNGYGNSSCGVSQYQRGSFVVQPGTGGQEEGYYDFADRYSQQPAMVPQSLIYQPTAGYSNAMGGLSSQNTFYKPIGAPMLPPMRIPDEMAMAEADMSHQSQQHLQAQQQAKEEKPVGGVSAKLDYDMDCMTDFVSEMAQGMYEILKSPICIADVDLFRSVQSSRPLPPSFRKWVYRVLSATRLPSATILLSLQYLSIRMEMLSNGGRYNAVEGQVYRLLTIALVLGSKFLDDNTFINRSWSEVSGINVLDLNQLEREWLVAIDFHLHRDPTEQQGFCSWLEHWKDYEVKAIARSAKPSKLSPLDTSVQHQRPVPKAFSSAGFQQSFNKPAPTQYEATTARNRYSASGFSQYDPWLVPRSATDTSPDSAPLTGPTTPEYYGGPGTWAPLEGYSRRSMFGYPSVTQPPQLQAQAQQQSQPTGYGTPFTPQYPQQMWSGHGMGCSCMYCARQQPYLMAHGYRPTPVVC